MPSSGTFYLKFNSVTEAGPSPWTFTGPSIRESIEIQGDGLTAQCSNFFPVRADGTYSLHGSMNSSLISLDGDPGVSYATLPTGFHVVNSAVHVVGQKDLIIANNNSYLTYGSGIEHIIPPGNNYDYVFTIPPDGNGDPIQLLTLLNEGCGVRIDLLSGNGYFIVNLLEIVGNYDMNPPIINFTTTHQP